MKFPSAQSKVLGTFTLDTNHSYTVPMDGSFYWIVEVFPVKMNKERISSNELFDK